MGQLQEARAQRRQHRAFETRRVAAHTGETLETAAHYTGAALGAAASMSVRGLGALADGARRGAVAAWGTRSSHPPNTPPIHPANLHLHDESVLPPGLRPAFLEDDREFEQVHGGLQGPVQEDGGTPDYASMGGRTEHEGQAAEAQDAQAGVEQGADLVDELREPEHHAEDSSAAGWRKLAKHEDMIVQLQATVASMQDIIQNMTEELDAMADQMREMALADRGRELEPHMRAATRPSVHKTREVSTFSMSQGDEGQLPPTGAGQDMFSRGHGGDPRGFGGFGGCGHGNSGGCGHQGPGGFGGPGRGQPAPAGVGQDMFPDWQQQAASQAKASLDAMKGLQLPKLEYQGRRSRAEQFAVWKDLVALQIQSLGEAGLACWTAIWTKVESAYRRHLASPYMQRSTIRVEDPHDVVYPDLERRLRPLLLQALTEGLRRGLLMRNTTACAEVLLELMIDAAPGSMDDRRTLQQSLTSLQTATSHRHAMHVLEAWSAHMRRAKEMHLEMPDSQLMLAAVKQAVSKVVERSKEMEYRVQVYMFQHNLPQETTRQHVEDFAAYLWSEMRNNDVTDVGSNLLVPKGQQANGVDTLKCFNCGGVGHLKRDCPELQSANDGKGKKKGQGKGQAKGDGKSRICRFWQMDAGCSKGADCSYQHPKKAGACTNCGSTQHKYADCTRPKKKSSTENQQRQQQQQQGHTAAQQSEGSAAAGAARIPACSAGVDALGGDWVCLDSGATHFVRKLGRHEQVPVGAQAVRLKLAVGSVRAWRMGCLVLVASQSTVSTLVPLGRVVRAGCRISWTQKGAELLLPNKKPLDVKVVHDEMFITRESMENC